MEQLQPDAEAEAEVEVEAGVRVGLQPEIGVVAAALRAPDSAEAVALARSWVSSSSSELSRALSAAAAAAAEIWRAIHRPAVEPGEANAIAAEAIVADAGAIALERELELD